MMRIGIVGYSAQLFDRDDAERLLRETINEVCHSNQNEITIVSGLTNLGIPAVAYKIAFEEEWKTIGIACDRANDFPCFPCDRVHIIGSNWGDESETFLAAIDVLIRIGGGKQSLAESNRAKAIGIPVFERELEVLK